MMVIQNKGLRNSLRFGIPFILIPAFVALGIFVSPEQSYAYVLLAITLLSLLLFYTGFEQRTVGMRRMVIVAVMTALSVLGRMVFALIPGFKPITALVVITAIYLGGESGFLVGSLSALLSNFSFGQGPWTPFQMLIWGLIGLFAGFLSRPLKQSRLMLAVYGVLAGILYSLFMDIWTVLWVQGAFQWEMYLTSAVAALPHTLSYAVSNVIFLLVLGRPFGEKLERVRLKYGV